ncbi:Kelch-like protein 6 [Sparganum proliferum]
MVKLPDLENRGVQFMVDRVNLENLATTWDFAKSMCMESLMETCLNLMNAQFKSLVSSDLFVRLPADTVLTLLRNDNLPVDSEEDVFMAIASWACSDCKEANNERLIVHAPEMLKEVRWCQTNLQFRNRLVDSHPMFQESNSCLGKGRDRWSVLRFDSRLENEEWVAEMEKREYATCSVVGESFFVVGGDTPIVKNTASVEEFLAGEQRWCKRPPLAVGRTYHAAAVVREAGGRALIGIFGGRGNDGRLSSCEVYDVRQERWFKLPDLREKRSATAAACLPGDSRVFVFGGRNDSCWLPSIEFCNLQADWRERAALASTEEFWQPAAPMRTARSALAATHFRGKIIVAGGYDGEKDLDVVEMFSPPDASCPQGQWTELAGMREPRWSFTLVTSTDAVFALGFLFRSRNTVETLTAPDGSVDDSDDLTSWTWSSKKPLQSLAFIGGAAGISM